VSFLVAFAAGAAVAALALFLERWSLGYVAISSPALAAYALLGGCGTAVARVALSRVLPAEAARLSALAAALAMLCLNALYAINVHLLAGEHYFSAKSLLYDVVVLVPLAAALLWISRSGWVAEGRRKHRQTLAAAGLAVLGWSTVTLGQYANGHAAPAPSTAAPDLPDIVLVILDSARRDHMGFHDYARPTSPQLDRLATRARVYERAFAASSWTVPTVSSLFGAPPSKSLSAAGLADMLAQRGYALACFTDNPHLTPGSELTAHFGLVQRSVGGWRHPLRRTLLGEMLDRLDHGTDEELVTRALAWMEPAGRPKFLYVHLMDSHTPYRFEPIDGRRRGGRRIEFPRSGFEMTASEAEDVVARYDAGVRSASDQAARLLAGVAQLKRPHVALVTADHGESLGEQGRWFHGTGLFPELLAVPLLALGEGVVPGRVRPAVGHASIPFTVLALARIPCEGCEGSDLRTSEGDAWIHGGMSESLRYTVALDHKLVRDARAMTSRLYSLNEDPGETVDIAGTRPELVRRLEQQPAKFGPLDTESIERLRALGYLGK